MQTLFYKEINADKSHLPCVILLHGLFGMSDNLLGLAKVLSSGYRVVIPDLINHGQSPKRDDMTYQSMASDVVFLMDKLDVKTATLVGHSMGGKVAMQVATSFPERIERLVVVDIAPVIYPARHLEIIEAMHDVENTVIKTRKEAELMLSHRVSEKPLIDFFMKNMKRNKEGNWKWCFGLNEITKAYPALCAAPIFKNRFDGNVLFIKGNQSDYIVAEYEPIIKQWFLTVQFKIVQGAGHWVHAEKPVVFNRLVLNFLHS